MRIATWNIWWRHGDSHGRLESVVAEAVRVNPDVLCLQEVSREDPDQLGPICDGLGAEPVVAPDDSGDHFGVHNAIVTRLAVIASGWDYLDVGDMPPHRTVVWARLEGPDGLFDVYTTHLSHGFHESALRRRQLRQIAALVAARRDPSDPLPPLLFGDLNAVPDSDEIRMLTGRSEPAADGLVFTDAWEHVGIGDGVTFAESNPYIEDSAWPNRRLDYALVGWPRQRPRFNPRSASLFGTEPVDGVVPSDHYGLVVELE